jgi:hypothetical protein
MAHELHEIRDNYYPFFPFNAWHLQANYPLCSIDTYANQTNSIFFSVTATAAAEIALLVVIVYK